MTRLTHAALPPQSSTSLKGVCVSFLAVRGGGATPITQPRNPPFLSMGHTNNSDSHSTYRVTSAIIPYYYTQLVGDAKHPPTLLADPTFNDMAVIGA